MKAGARWLTVTIAVSILGAVSLWLATLAALQPIPEQLLGTPVSTKPQVLDRRGHALTVTYRNYWNLHDRLALHEIPVFLQRAFILAEDKNFYGHAGVDWNARSHALWQNLKEGRIVRGASTITEQVARMRHPRPRIFWSRWLEGFEARRLESAFSKADILEFYLNQVPYAKNRRGVVQAARHYFDRDLATLNRHEMLALAVLVRAPTRMDPRRDEAALQKSIETLARRARVNGLLSPPELEQISDAPLDLGTPRLPVQAHHFVEHVYREMPAAGLTGVSRVHTTLDAEVQKKARAILENRLVELSHRNVNNAALLIVDHHSDEIIAWAGAHTAKGSSASWYDPVVVPRQPGSTLKPFLYAAALEKGWTAATVIDDAPLAESVLWGLHDYHNYSRRHYGPVRVRDALGNSLNIPALKTIQFVGGDRFLARLAELGMQSLREHPAHYGDGLALGNGEVALLELVGAYATLARQGIYRPLRAFRIASVQTGNRRVFSPETSSLIADILSDSDARKLEFGRASLLRFPVQTAVKTGTSSDYRDAWAIGFNHRYTAGVWMGNLGDQRMDQVTGARGPVLVLRSLFAELNRHGRTAPLPRSRNLVKARICRETGLTANDGCSARDEWFHPDRLPMATLEPAAPAPRLHQPSNGLLLAMDPRIPDEHEAFQFLFEGPEGAHRIEWYVDGRRLHAGKERSYLWPLERGEHTARVKVWSNTGESARLTPAVHFIVK